MQTVVINQITKNIQIWVYWTNNLIIAEGDRKAYFESAEWTMKENREKISKLRSENKELRKVTHNQYLIVINLVFYILYLK